MTVRIPSRRDGYLPIRDYAAIGDGRTVALVGLDGSVDWLCVPNLDSPSVFGAILDLDRGGAFSVQPSIPFTSERRYQPDSNLLETTFTTARGVVRLVYSVNIPEGTLCPLREIARTIIGVEGEVPMHWSASPRFEYGRSAGRQGHRGSCYTIRRRRRRRGVTASQAASWSVGFQPRSGPPDADRADQASRASSARTLSKSGSRGRRHRVNAGTSASGRARCSRAFTVSPRRA